MYKNAVEMRESKNNETLCSDMKKKNKVTKCCGENTFQYIHQG